MSPSRTLSAPEAAQALDGDCSAEIIIRTCNKYRGFGLRIGERWRVPERHIDLLRKGLTPAEIAALARNGEAHR